MLIAEVTLFGFRTENSLPVASCLHLCAGCRDTAALLWISRHTFGVVLAGYKTRDFTLAERLMTEARVMCLISGRYCCRIPHKWLYHDDIAISRGCSSPRHALAIAGIVALLVLSFVARKKAPVMPSA